MQQACFTVCLSHAMCLCFNQSDRVGYEYFRSWVIYNKDVTSITRWLLMEPCAVTLSNDLETPTFYQTLAGVTHCKRILLFTVCLSQVL